MRPSPCQDHGDDRNGVGSAVHWPPRFRFTLHSDSHLGWVQFNSREGSPRTRLDQLGLLEIHVTDTIQLRTGLLFAISAVHWSIPATYHLSFFDSQYHINDRSNPQSEINYSCSWHGMISRIGPRQYALNREFHRDSRIVHTALREWSALHCGHTTIPSDSPLTILPTIRLWYTLSQPRC